MHDNADARCLHRRRLVQFAGVAAVAGAAGLSRAGAASALQATPAAGGADCPATTPEENAALVERYWADVWSGGETDLTTLLTEDELHHWGFGESTVGHAEYLARLAPFMAAFPDFAIVPDAIVADGDLVASSWTATGTHEGEWMGIPATGKAIEYTGMNMFRFECGLIAESWGSADHLGLLRQIGGLPEPAAPEGTPSA